MKCKKTTESPNFNRFGEHFCFTSFGESHGPAIGGVVDGLPAGQPIDLEAIRTALEQRSGRLAPTGTSPRARTETDEVEWLSGVLPDADGRLLTTGTPVAFLIRNHHARPEDYEWMRQHCRPGHADYTYRAKYGRYYDYRGGGRASARETAARVVAGELAVGLLAGQGISIEASLLQVGEEKDPARFDTLLKAIQAAGDSIGGIVRCTVTGLPAGMGEPLFDKLQCRLAAAMLSINGCKGFEYGTGFNMSPRGSELYHPDEVPCPASGGIEGGLSNGLPITFRCAFKPAATLTRLYGGRHDACIAVRAVPVVRAMTALALQDFVMTNTTQHDE